MYNQHDHICFFKNWTISDDITYQLGQCEAIVDAISHMPILPGYRKELHTISLRKGAQATTAIEGNSLTTEEIKAIQEGKALRPSLRYMQKEIENVLKAFNILLDEIIEKQELYPITPEIIKRFHSMIGSGIGDSFQAIPGEFRKTTVIVGNYRPPHNDDVVELINNLCEWIKKEFGFEHSQTFREYVIEAIVVHIYIAWIHPFSDGNGRTARLLEYYILLRGGLPDIASHLLSNFYNNTRSEYYRHIEMSTASKCITPFLEYAIQGLCDGLKDVFFKLQQNQLAITWRTYIYEVFDSENRTQSEIIKRRRNIMLLFPYKEKKYLTLDEILNLNASIFREYANKSEKTFERDIQVLVKAGLLKTKDKKYIPNIEILNNYMAASINQKN